MHACRPDQVSGLPGQCLEMVWCVVRQFNVINVVHKEEFSLMRASIYFTHHIDSGAPSGAASPACITWSGFCSDRDSVCEEQRHYPAIPFVLQSLCPAERLT